MWLNVPGVAGGEEMGRRDHQHQCFSSTGVVCNSNHFSVRQGFSPAPTGVFLQQLPNFFGNSGVFSCSGSEVFFCNLEVFFATVPRCFLQRFWPAFLATVGW